jgi:hypothetical protein
MGSCKAFGKEVLVVGVLSSDEALERSARNELATLHGPVETAAPRQVFTWSPYYDEEMGAPIWRSYWAFRDFVDPATLASIKTATNAIERRLSIDGRRKVNLDPGLLAPGRFVLATTKDRAHRIALAEGIYAELTLIFERGEFHALPWTYPDWASEPVRAMLASWRHRLFPPR